MRSRVLTSLLLIVGVASLLNAHDLFVKLDTYFVPPHSPISVKVLNGTFTTSENAITRDRLLDLSVISTAGRTNLDTTAWTPEGKATRIALETGEPGTYVLGVSTRPRMIELEGSDFNEYLEHDGIPDILEARRQDGELDKPARERYHKHVKAIFQVGQEHTGAYNAVLGYPAEVVAMVNPYSIGIGDELRVRCLVDGEPVANQLVIAGGEGAGGVLEARSTRTDAHGVARFTIDAAGKWYVKFIHMAPVAAQDLDYESKWATLTFEVR